MSEQTAQLKTGLSVQAQNEPGVLARITNAVAEEGLNVEGFFAPAKKEEGRLFLFIDDPDTAFNTLEELDYNVRQEEFVLVDAPNEVGVLAKFTEPLSKRNIDVDTAFLTFKKDQPQLAFQTSANKQALNLFQELL